MNFIKQQTNTQKEYLVEISEWSVANQSASVSFEYQVDAERYYDFFYFSMDGSTDYLLRADQQLTWAKVSFQFKTAGFHTLQWFYVKDSSKDEGEDRAKIRKITVTGAVDKEVVLRCEQCPKGTYSDGTVPCAECAPGTYADEAGLTTCKICPPGKISFSGATECFLADVACIESDYSYKYSSDCDNGSRTKQYFWIEPKSCNESRNDSVQLPPDEIVSCNDTLKCSTGMKKTIVGSSQTCTYCEPGSFNDHGNYDSVATRSLSHSETECEACKVNEASRVNIVHLYDVLGGVFTPYTSKCTGECISSIGWRDIGAVGLDSGVGNGKSVASLFFEDNLPSVSLDDDISPYFRVRLFLSCPSGSANRVDFLVDGISRKSIFCSGCQAFDQNNGWQTVDVPLTMTERKKKPLTFTIMFVSTDAMSSRNESFYCDRAVVSTVSLFGVVGSGGAVVCETCKGGYYPKLDQCLECSAGTYSIAASATCETCMAKQFSYNASEQCYNCGSGQTSTPGSALCSWIDQDVCALNGTVSNADRRFEFNKLGQLLADSRFFTTTLMDAVFYFDICKGRNTNQPRTLRSFQNNIFSLQDLQLLTMNGLLGMSSSQDISESVCPPSSLACIRYRNGQVVDMGNSISLETIYNTNSSVNNVGIGMTLTNYQNVCFNNVTQQDGPSTVKVIAMCSTDSSSASSLSDSPRIRATDATQCNFVLETLSIYGCPLCQGLQDFNRLEGECNKDTRTRSIRFVKKEGLEHKCARGDDLTNTVLSEVCEPNSINTPYWIIGVVIGVGLVILVAISLVAGFLFYKYRDISKKYNQLQEEDTTTNSQL